MLNQLQGRSRTELREMAVGIEIPDKNAALEPQTGAAGQALLRVGKTGAGIDVNRSLSHRKALMAEDEAHSITGCGQGNCRARKISARMFIGVLDGGGMIHG